MEKIQNFIVKFLRLCKVNFEQEKTNSISIINKWCRCNFWLSKKKQ